MFETFAIIVDARSKGWSRYRRWNGLRPPNGALLGNAFPTFRGDGRKVARLHFDKKLRLWYTTLARERDSMPAKTNDCERHGHRRRFDRSVSRALALVAIVANTTTPLILGTVQAHAHGVDGDPPSEFRVVCSAGGLGFLGGKDIDPRSDIDGNMDNSRPVCSAPSINALSVDPIDFRGFLPIAARRARITFSHNVQKRGQVFRVRPTVRAPPVLP